MSNADSKVQLILDPGAPDKIFISRISYCVKLRGTSVYENREGLSRHLVDFLSPPDLMEAVVEAAVVFALIAPDDDAEG